MKISTIQELDNITESTNVGILGGSFNPPHKGHMHISNESLERLHIQYLIWLVTPHNTFKSAEMLKTFDARVAAATKFTQKNKQIIVSDIEKHWQTNGISADVMERFALLYPKVQFFWIMGADNMCQIHLWERWETIFQHAVVVIYDRQNYAEQALQSVAAKRFTRLLELSNMQKSTPNHYNNRILNKDFDWIFIRAKKINISSTAIREKLKLRGD